MTMLHLRKIFTIIFLSYSSFCFSQGKISFKEEIFDFGTVQEGTQAVHEFEFTNDGNAPVVISNVQASCGCTTPFWTKEPVLPGGKGVIKASYNSSGRPGAFNKSITITSNAEQPSKVVYIKGSVAAAAKNEAAVSAVPKMQPETKVVDMGKVVLGQKTVKTLNYRNMGDTPLNVLYAHSPCNCITYKPVSGPVGMGESGTVEFTFTAKAAGQFNEFLTLYTDDKQFPETRLHFKATVTDGNTSIIKETKSTPFNQ